jgi:hypothetical protein
LAVARPVGAGVSHEVHISQVLIGAQRVKRQQTLLRYEIHCEVQLVQRLAALQVLNLGDVVQGQIQVLQLFQTMYILDLVYQIALQEQDLEVPACLVQQLDLFNVLLMKGELLQIAYHALVVLRSLHPKAA